MLHTTATLSPKRKLRAWADRAMSAHLRAGRLRVDGDAGPVGVATGLCSPRRYQHSRSGAKTHCRRDSTMPTLRRNAGSRRLSSLPCAALVKIAPPARSGDRVSSRTAIISRDLHADHGLGNRIVAMSAASSARCGTTTAQPDRRDHRDRVNRAGRRRIAQWMIQAIPVAAGYIAWQSLGVAIGPRIS